MPENSLIDRINGFRSLLDTFSVLYPQLADLDFRRDATKLDVSYYLEMLSELVAHRLLGGPAVGDALVQELGPVVAAQGWSAAGQPFDAQCAAWDVHARSITGGCSASSTRAGRRGSTAIPPGRA